MKRNSKKSSKYIGVSYAKNPKRIFNPSGEPFWCARYQSGEYDWSSKHFETEREAAIAYDLKMIELGKDPVNILKKKCYE